jgi:hypothetical protein
MVEETVKYFKLKGDGYFSVIAYLTYLMLVFPICARFMNFVAFFKHLID